MPAVAKTSRQHILRTAEDLLGQRGEEGVTFLQIAKRCGVKGPSLYKHFPDREALIHELEVRAFAQLGNQLSAAPQSVIGLASAFLSFASLNPGPYSLLFKSGDPSLPTEAIRPVLVLLENILGNREEALTRARVIASFLHGYALMERSGAFRLGGDPAACVAVGLKLIVPEASGTN